MIGHCLLIIFGVYCTVFIINSIRIHCWLQDPKNNELREKLLCGSISRIEILRLMEKRQ